MMRLSRIAVPVLALVALLAIVVGIPVALLVLVGSPIPDPWPTGAELGDMVAGRMAVPADLIISVLAAVMWILWFQVAWATAVEVAAVLRGRMARRAPVAPGLQVTVGKLVTTVTLLTTTLAARPVAAGPLPPVVAITQTDDATVGASARSTANGAVSAVAATGPAVTAYVTQPGDTWWGIAESSFGSGTRWKEIRNLNLGRAMEDGTVISVGTDLLRPDWRLLLPSPSGAAALSPAVAPTNGNGSVPTVEAVDPVDRADREIVVESGDTIWDLAEEDLAEAGHVPSTAEVADRVDEISELNQAELGGNPDLIHPGQRLEMPARPALAERAPGVGTVVEEADSPGEADAPAEVDPVEEADAPEGVDAPSEVDPVEGADPAPDTDGEPTPETDGAPPDDASLDAPPDDTSLDARPAEPPATTTPTEPVESPTTPTEPPATTAPTEPVESTVPERAPEPESVETSAPDPVEAAPTLSPLRPVGEIGGTGAPLDLDAGADPADPPTDAPDPSTSVSVQLDPTPLAGVTATSPERPDRFDRPAATARFLPNAIVPSVDGPARTLPVDALAPSVSDVDLPASATSDGRTLEVTASQSPGSAELDTATSRAPIFVGLAAITLVGGYLHRAFKRRRKTAFQHRHPGRMPRQPKRKARTLTRRLAAAAEPEHPELLNLGLRALARLLQDTPTAELPRISGAWISHDRLVLALADESSHGVPPAPFVPFADGSGWSLHRSHFDEIRAIARGVNGPLPLLTTIGTTTALDLALTTNSRAPADAYGLVSSLLFAVDLEVGRVISVQGPRPTDVVEALSMMALELATSETADQAEIVCVGFGRRLETFERVMVVDDLSEIIEDLEDVADRARFAAGDASPFATRVGNGAADTWNPVIVFHADPRDPEAQVLTQLAEQTEGGVTAVCGYPTDTGWTFLVDGDEIRCPDLPGSLGHHRFTRARPDDVDSIAELFDDRWDEVELDDEFWRPIDPDDFDLGLGGPDLGLGGPEDEAGPGHEAGPEIEAGHEIDVRNGVERDRQPVTATVGTAPGELDGIDEADHSELGRLRHSIEHRPVPPVEPGPTPARGPGDRHLYMVTPTPLRTPTDDSPTDGAAPDGAAPDGVTTGDRAGAVEGGPVLRVNVLGHYTVGGFHVGDRVKPWKYTKTAELILYLLLHPQGASQDLLMEQLFPEQPPNRPRLNQLVSDARTKALGVDASGEYHLPHASPTDPFYRLTSSVSFDLRDFALHCAKARKAESLQEQARHWRSALELVEGRPFTLPHDGYGWAMPEIEATIVKVEEAAVALADVATELGDHELAVWATKKGLLTGTGYYELLVKRGRSALLAEDPEEIVRAFADLQLSLDYTGAPEEGMPDLSHHPELEDVYNDLSDERGRDRSP